MIGQILLFVLVGVLGLTWGAGLFLLPIVAYQTGDITGGVYAGLMWFVALTGLCLWMEW